ncbi:MAG: M15 family metallopeptidase [Lachnospiraceae bacterium]|jgi:D-alanyl-D-alanine carboxypeptidase|nr:M15 family metallopeptidase [Lachnospiraceae bacterium]
MKRRSWGRDPWRGSRRNQARRQRRKLLLGFLGVGMLMFFVGVYVGSVYVAHMAKQELLAAGVQKQVPQVNAEERTWLIGAANPAGMAAEKAARKVDEASESEEEVPEEPEEELPQDWNLRLVNSTHSLPEDFTVELKSIGSGHQLDARIVDDYKAMIRAAKKDGVTIYVTSSYRDMNKQVELHQEQIAEHVKKGYSYQEAQRLAARMVAVPGTSEHQLGLAVDLVSAEYRKLDEKQENTKGFQWLKEHCWEYGFILRYPNGRTDITGIIYEPWHFRYVGEKAAQEITERGITLEEYLGARPVSESWDTEQDLSSQEANDSGKH